MFFAYLLLTAVVLTEWRGITTPIFTQIDTHAGAVSHLTEMFRFRRRLATI